VNQEKVTEAAAQAPGIAPSGWQARTVEQLKALLQPNERVRALALFGTAGGPAEDLWSDIDLLVVAEVGEFYPATGWLAPVGELYTIDQSQSPFYSVTRACFRDFRRIDFLVASEAALERIEEWPRVPFWNGTQLLFSRSPIADRALARSFAPPEPEPISDEGFAAVTNGFWFKGILAVTKVMRDDLLIGLHLALEMLQECLVLGMLLRDRAAGTAHHRRGGPGNDDVARLAAAQHPFTAAGILDTLEACAIAFDELCARWSPGYRERRHPLLAWIGFARRHLAGGQP
jgi:hypothetical protein